MPMATREEKKGERKLDKGPVDFLVGARVLAEPQAVGKVSEVHRRDRKLAGRCFDVGERTSLKLHQSGVTSRHQKWGFADPRPSVSQPGILSNEIHTVQRVCCVSKPGSRKVERKTAAAVSWAPPMDFSTDDVCGGYNRSGRATEGKWEDDLSGWIDFVWRWNATG